MNSLLRSDLVPCTWNTEIKSDSIVNSFRSKITVHALRTSSLHQLFLGSEFESRWISNFFRPLFAHVVHITMMILSSMTCFSTDEMKFYNAFEEHGVKRGVHHNYLWGSLSRLLCLVEKTIMVEKTILWQQLTFICNRPPPRCSTPPNGGWNTVFDIKNDMSFPRKWNLA